MTRFFPLLAALLVAPLSARADSLVLWHAYSDEEARGLNEALRAYEHAHPGTRVETVQVTFGAYLEKLRAAIPTGHGPDLFIDAHERLATHLERHLVAPLGAIPDAELREFDASHIEPVSSGGVLYGLPLNLKCAALYVNEAFVSDAPSSLAEFENLTLPEGVVPLVFEAENAYYAAAFFHAYGGTLLGRDGTFGAQNTAGERALERIAELASEGTIPDELDGALVQQMFVSGKAAMAISGPWLAPEIPPSVRYHVVSLPTVEDVGSSPLRPFLTIEGIFVGAESSRTEKATSLARFLAGREASVLRARLGRQVVAARDAWNDPALENDSFLVGFRVGAMAAVPMPVHSHMSAVFEPLNAAIRKVLRGDLEPRAALVEAKHRFEDNTRALPAPRDPSVAMLAVGAVLLLVVLLAVRRASRPEVRVALERSLPAYRYLFHAAIVVGAVVVLPVVVGIATSLFSGVGRDLYYVGIANYVDILSARGRDLFGHGSFYLVLGVTLLWTIANLVLHVLVGGALALLLHRPAMRLRGIYRVLLIVPWAVPSYVTALSWKGMFHRQFGAINAILESLGAEPVSWFARWSTAFSANLATNVWLGFPFMMVVTLGALSAIPKDLYEAAEVDGASAWQRFRWITLPLLRPAIAPAVAMGAVWTFNMFNVIYLVSGGEPDGSTEILVSEAYRWAFTRSSQYGYAAAYAVLIFALLIVGSRWSSRRLDAMGATT